MGFKTESIGWALSFRMMCKNNGGKRTAFKINRTKLNRYISRAAAVKDYDIKEPITLAQAYKAKDEEIKSKHLKSKIEQYKIFGELTPMQKEILEYQMYLQSQTPEQFRLAKLHGWKWAKILTSPEPNFHYE